MPGNGDAAVGHVTQEMRHSFARKPAGIIVGERTDHRARTVRPRAGSSAHARWSVKRVISDERPSRSAKPGHNPVPLLTYSVMSPTW